MGSRSDTHEMSCCLDHLPQATCTAGNNQQARSGGSHPAGCDSGHTGTADGGVGLFTPIAWSDNETFGVEKKIKTIV